VYAPESLNSGSLTEIHRFSFPRQPSGDYLSLADYFTAAGSDTVDVVASRLSPWAGGEPAI
jgi:cobalamin-dependent methionine synthase I